MMSTVPGVMVARSLQGLTLAGAAASTGKNFATALDIIHLITELATHSEKCIGKQHRAAYKGEHKKELITYYCGDKCEHFHPNNQRKGSELTPTIKGIVHGMKNGIGIKGFIRIHFSP